MRVFLLSKADLLGNLNLNRLVPALAREHEVRVYLSDSVQPEEREGSAALSFTRQVRDYPTDSFFPALDALPEVPARPARLTFAGLARRHAVPVVNLGASSRTAFAILEDAVRGAPPDVILCCRHDFIIPERIYSLARNGAYNTHSGLLPHYRGPFCSFWSMFNRERRSACSLHALTPRVDAGDIVGVGGVELDYGASLLRNLANIYQAGLDEFFRLLPDLAKGPLPGVPQEPGVGKYYREPNARERGEFLARGLRFVDAGAYRRLLGEYVPAGLAGRLPPWPEEGAG